VGERTARLRDVIAAKNRRFRQSFVGRELPAVTLHTSHATMTQALTDNFLEVQLDVRVPANQSVRTMVTGLTASGLTGTITA
jgi:tRNA A37 methylthiotransferase MiaB